MGTNAPKTAVEMKKRGHPGATIDKVIYQNPKKFLSQSPKFKTD
jgi:predicted metal-dependent TIM-barrel fold hydrolase